MDELMLKFKDKEAAIESGVAIMQYSIGSDCISFLTSSGPVTLPAAGFDFQELAFRVRIGEHEIAGVFESDLEE